MDLLEKFRSITTFIFDVDGVLTDGTVYVFDDGQQVRRMNIHDGFALQLAVKKGYRILVISGGQSPAVVSRLNKLGIIDIHMGVQDKHALLLEYMACHALTAAEVLFMGDDIPDYQAMKAVGLPCSPADATPDIIRIATYISSLPGGLGCVREVIEKVLKLKGHWELDTEVASR